MGNGGVCPRLPPYLHSCARDEAAGEQPPTVLSTHSWYCPTTPQAGTPRSQPLPAQVPRLGVHVPASAPQRGACVPSQSQSKLRVAQAVAPPGQ